MKSLIFPAIMMCMMVLHNGFANTYDHLYGSTEPMEKGLFSHIFKNGMEQVFSLIENAAFLKKTLVFVQGDPNTSQELQPFAFGPDDITGKVWEDWNFNGVMDEIDTFGVEDITVQLYDCQGNIIGSTLTDANGDFLLNSGNTSFSINANERYRLEFTIPASVSSWAVPTQSGADNGTTVQYLQKGDVGNLGLAAAEDFCQANPFLVTNCYIEGDNSGVGDVLVSFRSQSPTSYDHESIASQIGTTFGLAYQRSSGNLFASSFMKRFAGFGNSPGSIFIIDNPADGANSGAEFVDLNSLFGSTFTGTDPHDFTSTTSNGDVIDAASFDAVGRVSLGDMDIASDEKSLWVINLNGRSLCNIPLGNDPANPTAPNSPFQINIIQLLDGNIAEPNPLPSLPAGITENEIRPFGLKVKDNIIYIGLVTNGEDGGPLNALIYSYDPVSQGFAKVLEFSLEYDRGCALAVNSTCYGPAKWNAWVSSYPSTPAMVLGNEHAHPQPMLTDIEFDANGNMIVGLRDRFGDQTGYRAPLPDGGTNLRIGDALGDIILATRTGTNSWVVDTSDFRDPTLSVQANGATEKEQFFGDDNFIGSNDLHEETASGGLAVLPGTNTVVTTNIDPFVSFSAGLDWFNSDNGTLSNSFEILAQLQQFNKANGLGELEAICNPAPIEIGNYVWEDLDGDGIQDACEPGLSGVNVDLYDISGNRLAFTITDTYGQYYFSHSDSTDQVWLNGPDSIRPNSMYYVVVGKGQFANDQLMANGDDYSLTLDSTNSATNRFLKDSDGTIAQNTHPDFNGFPYVKITTSDWGNSDHSFDFGFYDCLPDSAVFNEIICEGDSYSFGSQNLTVSGAYYDSLTSVDGCDSVLILHLTVQPATEIVLNEEICPGDPYDFNGQLLGASGTYHDTLFYASGCDSVRTTLNLTVLPSCSDPVFDLALRKILAPGQSLYVTSGESATFRIYIYNQGDFDAYNILVVDYPPLGFDYNAGMSPGWLNFGAGPTWFLPFLPKGGIDSLDITFNLNANAADGDLFNYAEITSADDDFNGSNTPPTDVDSTPNALVSDDPGGTPGSPADNIITGDGTGAIGSNDPLTDEDDHDGEMVILTEPILSLGNLVFFDFNNDGLFDENTEAGVEDVEVELYEAGGDGVQNTADDALIATTMTNGFGEYLFTGLIDGLYYVKLTGSGIPIGYRSSTGDGEYDNDGSGPYDPAPSPNDDIDNNDDGTQMVTMILSDLIQLSLNGEPGGNQNLTLDFGLYSPQSESLTLGNQVFHDKNNDGLFNNNDVGIEDVEVALFDLGADGQKGTADDNQLALTTTNGFGEYQFTGLEEGTYYVKLTGAGIPTDYVSSTGEGVVDNDGAGPYEPFVGTDNNVDDEDDGTQMGIMVMSDIIVLNFNGETNDGDNNPYSNPSVDFGLYLPETDPKVSFGNLVFYDMTNNGVFDGPDYGIEDVQLILFYPGPDGLVGTPDDEPVDTTITNGFGEYLFDELLDSAYYVKLSGIGIPTGYISSTGDGVYDKDTMGIYEPAASADVSIDGIDDGTQMDSMIVSSIFNLALGTETGDGDSDPDHNPSIDFGLYLPQDEPVFDLALQKVPAVGQVGLVEIGDNVTFTVRIINQGTQPAYNVLVIDYLPLGFTFNVGSSPGWVDFGAGPSWFYPGPLMPGTSDSINIVMTVNSDAVPGTLQNYAEISGADNDTNGTNTPPTDLDSNMDAFFGNDPGGKPGLPADDAIDGDGSGTIGSNDPLTDEDDMDGAEVQLDVPTLFLGNLVFADYDNDGIFNNTDEGIAGVTLELYEVGADGEKGTADDEYIDFKISNSIGEYLFHIYSEGLYYVKLTGNGVPANHVSSTGEGINDYDADGPYEPFLGTDSNVDNDDDGSEMGVMVMSDTIRLTFGGEPTGAENNENLTVDFGLYEPIILTIVDVGNQVFHDENNDGVFNNLETGIENVEVKLFDVGADGEKGTNDDVEVATTMTNNSGEYQFVGINEGLYYVKLTGVGIPVNYVSSTGDGIYDNDANGAFEPSLGTDNDLDNLDDGTQMGMMIMSDTIRLVFGGEPDFDHNNTVDFGLYEPRPAPTNSLGNLVFADIVNNGLFDGADYGIENVEVKLFGLGADGIKGTNDDVELATTSTDANGEYQFTGLAEGVYYVKLTGVGVPTNWASSTGDGINDADGAGPFEPFTGTDNNFNNNDDGTQMGSMIMSDTIHLTWFGEPETHTNNTVDFGLYELPRLTLGNQVFYDNENDGLFNNSNAGIEGVEVILFTVGADGEKGTNDDVQISSQLTNASGKYLFSDLDEGLYYVQLSGTGIPSNYKSSTGDGIFDMDDAGAFEPSLGTDANADNEDDGTAMGVVVMSDTIRLAFNSEPDGNSNNTVDFGFYLPQDEPTNSLGNLVFADVNNNGFFNSGDYGLENIEVKLMGLGADGEKGTNDDVEIATTTTDINGNYQFTGLDQGLYYVKLSGVGIPTGWVSSTGQGIYDLDGAGPFEPSVGTDGDFNNVDDGTQMGAMIMSDTIRLTWFEEPEIHDNNTVDFGLYEPQALKLGNLVFYDNENDGIFNNNDAGIENVEVMLFSVGTDGEKGTNDDVQLSAQVTNSFGDYQFTGLVEGLYYVKLSGTGIPTGYISSTGDGVFDMDGAGAYEPSLGTDNNIDGNDDGTSMNPMVMSDTIRLVLNGEPDGNTNNTVDFGFYLPQTQPTLSLGNLVFADYDNDGIFNNNDSGIEDVEVVIFEVGPDGEKGTNDDVQIATQLTNGFGQYLFIGLDEGLYYVKLSGIGIPVDYVSSTGEGVFDMDANGAYEPSLGTDGNADNIDDGTQMGIMIMSDTFRLTLGDEPGTDVNLTVDFGLYQPQILPTLSLGNLVFLDADNDGLFNNNDTGIVNIEVLLFDVGTDGEKGTNDDIQLASQTTDSNGEYLFENLTEGLYFVKLSGSGLNTNLVSSTGDGPFDMDQSGAYEPYLGTDNNIDNNDDGTLMGAMFMSDTIRLTFNDEPGGNVNTTVDFGLYEPQTPSNFEIGNLVFHDFDNDGLFNNNDTGIVNVEVALYKLGTDGIKGTADDVLITAQLTDANGNYLFTNQSEDLFYVKLTGQGIPIDFVSSTGEGIYDNDAVGPYEPSFGTDLDIDNQDDGTQMGVMIMSDTIRLTNNSEPEGNTNRTVDFGLYLPQEQIFHELGNLVFQDLDNDGLFNNNDTGLVNVEVALYKLGTDGIKGTADDVLVTAQLTDANGNYLFQNQSADLFYVKLTGFGIPANFVSSTGEGIYDDDASGPYEPFAGTDMNIDNEDDGTQMGSMIMSDTIRLTDNDEPEGNTNRTVDFGLYEPQEEPTNSLGNLVFADYDNDGIFNNNDLGISGVEVELYDLGVDGMKGTNDDNLIDTKTTDLSGKYLFSNLFEGVYYVKLNGNGIPANFVSSTGEGEFDQDGSGPFEPIFGTDNNVDNQDDGTQMGIMIMSDTIRLTKFGEPNIHENTTVDFGLYEPQTIPTLSLGNLVFNDQDNDGIFNNDDVGLANLEVKLFDVGPDGDKNTNDDIELATLNTTGQGGYLFTGLSEGLYFVKLTGTGIPAGYISSTGDGRFDNDGNGAFEPSTGTDNDVDDIDDGTQMGVMVMSDTIRLKLNTEPGGNVNPTVDFGLYLPLEYASVGDRIWFDDDENGQQNGSESGVPNVTLQLFDLGADGTKGNNDDNLINTQQTDGDGLYSFTGIEPGDYYVMISTATLPANFILTGQDQGADATDSDFNAMGMTEVFNLGSGENNLTIDAGIQPTKSSLGDYVWFDNDHDGQQGTNEPAVPNLPVHLYNLGNDGMKGGGDDNLLSSTITDSDGLYFFKNLSSGSYYVVFDISVYAGTHTVTQQDTGSDISDSDANAMGMTDEIVLGIGEHNGTIDFGLEPELASLGDMVWFDVDHDGQKDVTESGVPNMPVNLFDLGTDGIKGTNDDNLINTTMTDNDGIYSFIGLEPGIYYVMFGLSPFTGMYTATQQNMGNDNFDSDANAMGMTGEIVLSAGEVNTTIDFGIEPKLASLGGFVWFDDDVNGQQNNGEQGVPNVLVKIFDLGNDGMKGGGDDNEIAAQLTGNDGLYDFANLEPGDYYVQFDTSTFPADYFTTTPNSGNDATDSDANSMGMTDAVNLPPGDNTKRLDVGVYNPMFDLALTKSLAAGQSNMVDIGNEVHYQIKIKNEGLTDAYNVLVTDHIPTGMAFSTTSIGWTLVNDSTATYTIAGPIVPNQEVVLDIYLIVQFGLSNSTLTNVAEVDSATDINGITVTDIDSTPNNNVPDEDDTDEEEITLLEHDPTGWIYCEKTGRIISGGTITVTGPNGMPNDEVVILADGSSGYYEFYAVGATGTYTIQYNHPVGYPFSADCPPGGTFDPPNGGGDVTLGADAMNGFLQDTSCTANPYYFIFDLEPGDPPIYANNFPVQCSYIGSIVCEDTNNNDQVDAADQRIAGATVNLYDCSDQTTPIATTQTDANGRYSFDGLVPGNYMLGYQLPAGTRFVSNGTMNTNGFSNCISLNWGECDTSKVICQYICPAVTADDRTICFGGSAQLNATVPYGNGMFSWVPPNDLDNAAIANPMANPSVTTTYFVTYSDGLGCLDSDDATVNVLNTTPYITNSPFVNLTVECDQPIPFEAPVFADDCDTNLTITLDSIVTAPGCGVTIERTWTATNAQGNSISFTQTVNVVDNTPPVMMANHPLFGNINHGDTLYADCLDIPSLDSLGFSAFDYCCATTRTFEENVTPGDCDVDGYVERRYCGWTATDCCGNTDSLYFTIFVLDMTGPVLSGVPANVTVECGNVPVAPVVTANDACSGPSPVVFDEMIWGDSTSGCYLIMRSWTATDSCGNETTEMQNVLVQDFTPPVLQDVPASGIADCSNLGNPNVTATDNCDGLIPVTLSENISADSNGCITQVDRTWTAFDGCGNMAFATQTLVIQNNDDPQITIINPMFAGNQHGDTVYVNCDQVQVLSAADATATADCCGVPTIEFHEYVSNGDCETDGYLVSMICGWTATDCCGNMDSLFITVIVVDNTPPALQNVPANMSYQCVGNVPMPPNITATDNCDDNVDVTFNEITEFVNGQLQTTRTWTATDDCGNVDTQSQIITYTQENPPFILNVPADVTVATSADVPAPSANVLAADDCDPQPSLTVMDEPAGSGCCYYITRIWTATDNSGLMAVDSQIITVQDMEPPVIIGVPEDVVTECTFDEVFVTPISVMDNCTANPAFQFSQDTTYNQCFYEITRTWTATDECGNSTSETQTITVTDTIPPTTYAFHSFFGEIQHGDVLFADCSQIASLDSLGFATTDNCGGEVTRTFEESVTTGNCLIDGFIEFRYCGWTVTDPCGNSDSLFFTVFISDYQFPVLSGVPADVTVDCNNIPPNDAIVTASDNCSTSIQVLMQEDTVSVFCPNTYTLERKWMAIDECGNLTKATQAITVIDETPPTTFANHSFFGEIQHGDTLYATCDQISILDSFVFESNDDCSSVNQVFAEQITGGNCLNDGFVESHVRGWAVSDACGNTDSLFFTVIIIDNEAPALIGVPADVTVACDSVPAPATVTATDNCYGDLMVLLTTDSIPGSCSASYVLNRTWSVIDSCGNSASQTQVITVVNETPPTMYAFHNFFGEIFHGDTLYADCTQIPSLDSLGFDTYDECCETTRTFEENVVQGDCDVDGFIEQRYCGWTSTDCCGNTDSLYFTVIVRDLEGPMITGVPADTNVICGNIPDLSDVTVIDNCDDNPFYFSIETIDREFCPFTITRVWIAEDDCGNVTTDTQYIHVFEEFRLDFALTHPLLSDIENGDTLMVECNEPIIFGLDDAEASTNCSQLEYTFNEDHVAFGDCDEDGFIAILSNTWSASDDCGHDTSVTVYLKYVDTRAPVFSNLPADTTINCGDAVPDFGVPDVMDECGTVNLESIDSTIVAPDGEIRLRIWSAIDECGNSSRFTQAIIVMNTEMPELENIFSSPETCDSENGAAIVFVTGNETDFTYEWNPDLGVNTDSVGNSRNGLPGGMYDVIVADGPCKDTFQIEVLEECDCVPATIDSISITSASCGDNDASATIYIAENLDEYTFTWIPDHGTPNAGGNSRTELVSGHYVVIMVHNNDNSCVSTVEFDIYDNCQLCGPMFEELAFVAQGPDSQLIEVCLPVPFGVAIGMDISVDGQPYSEGIIACDQQMVKAYNYSLMPGMGQAGSYSVVWEHSGQMFSTVVSTMDELAAKMSQVDTAADWYNDQKAFQLITTNLPGDYSGLYIYDIQNNGQNYLPAEDAMAEMGTTFRLVAGQENVILSNPENDCSDVLLLEIEALPDVSVFAADTLVFSVPCEDDVFDYCFELPASIFNDFSFTLNGGTIDSVLEVCAYEMTTFYAIGSLQSFDPPFQIDGWEVNGQMQAGTFSTFDELVEVMNQWDAGGNWNYDNNASIIYGGNMAVTYGDLSISHTASSVTFQLAASTNTVASQYGIQLEPGTHHLAGTHLATGLSDEVIIQLACVTSDQVTISMPVGSMDTFCLDLGELPGEIDDFIEFCDNSPISNAIIEPIPGTFCLDIEGISIGTSETCIVICDETGFCDTTFLQLRVLPKKQGPPQSPDNPPVNGLLANNNVTPNGDGINDYFKIQDLENHPQHRLTIFDQLGRRVFHSNDYQNNWDGRNKNGQVMSGVYYYVLETEAGMQSGEVLVVY